MKLSPPIRRVLIVLAILITFEVIYSGWYILTSDINAFISGGY